MIFQHSVSINCPPQLLAEKLRSPKLLAYVSWPILQMVPIDPALPPETFTKQKFLVKLRLFGFLPMGWQIIDVTCADRSGEKGKFWFEMHDNGSGQFIAKWDHTITVTPNGQGALYKDSVEIKAGMFTLSVWLFASVFYRHRQKRLKELAEKGFEFPALFNA